MEEAGESCLEYFNLELIKKQIKLPSAVVVPNSLEIYWTELAGFYRKQIEGVSV